MNKLVKYSSALVLASVSLASHAAFEKGGVNGGGGRSVVCRDSSGKIKSAELLDLWEARVIDKLKLRKALPTFRANLVDALKRYDAVLGATTTDAQIDLTIKEIDSLTTFLPDSVKLETVDDSKEPAVPVGCKVEQLAHLYEDHRLLIQKSIWDHLNPQNKAALIIHESIYYERREQGAPLHGPDSRHAQELRGDGPQRAPLAVVAHSGAMRLVARLLQQPERR